MKRFHTFAVVGWLLASGVFFAVDLCQGRTSGATWGGAAFVVMFAVGYVLAGASEASHVTAPRESVGRRAKRRARRARLGGSEFHRAPEDWRDNFGENGP